MIEIKIETGNAAFDDDYAKAVNHVLLQVQDIANRLGEGRKMNLPMIMKLMDGNGNAVGTVKFDKR